MKLAGNVVEVNCCPYISISRLSAVIYNMLLIIVFIQYGKCNAHCVRCGKKSKLQQLYYTVLVRWVFAVFGVPYVPVGHGHN